MRFVILSLALATSGAWAQDKPAAKEPAKPAVAVEKSASVTKKSRRAEDARHCLEKASNNEVIKCAEAYL
jgi:hypothetical protein